MWIVHLLIFESYQSSLNFKYPCSKIYITSLENVICLYAMRLDVFNKADSVSEANLMTPYCLPESGCDLIISSH